MFEWFANTLRTYPEIAIFISLAFGYYFGSFTYKGLGLGAVTATLIAAVIIGQLGITVTGPLKSFFFLMFLFAIGYAVGPQFVRGIAKDGLPQAMFAAVQCVFCLLSAYLVAKLAGYDVGSAVGPLCRLADDLGVDGPRHRCDQPARAAAGGDQEPARRHAGRLRGDLHLRHGRLRGHHRPARPGPARHQPRRSLQALRGEARRHEGGRRSRARPGTSSTCVPTAFVRTPASSA